MSQPLLFPLLKVGRTLPQALGLALFSLIGALGMIPLGLISVIWKIHRLVYLVGSFHSHCMVRFLPASSGQYYVYVFINFAGALVLLGIEGIEGRWRSSDGGTTAVLAIRAVFGSYLCVSWFHYTAVPLAMMIDWWPLVGGTLPPSLYMHSGCFTALRVSCFEGAIFSSLESFLMIAW